METGREEGLGDVDNGEIKENTETDWIRWLGFGMNNDYIYLLQTFFRRK